MSPQDGGRIGSKMGPPQICVGRPPLGFEERQVFPVSEKSIGTDFRARVAQNLPRSQMLGAGFLGTQRVERGMAEYYCGLYSVFSYEPLSITWLSSVLSPCWTGSTTIGTFNSAGTLGCPDPLQQWVGM